MNLIVISGNLTKDCELRTTQSGKSVAQFSLAVKRPFTNDQTDFFDVAVWGKLGEICGKYLTKGRKVTVEGAMTIRSYEDRNGNKRIAPEVIAENVEFNDTKRQSENNEQKGSNNVLEMVEVTNPEQLPF